MIHLTYAGKFWLAYAVFLVMCAYAAPDLWAWFAGESPVNVN